MRPEYDFSGGVRGKPRKIVVNIERQRLVDRLLNTKPFPVQHDVGEHDIPIDDPVRVRLAILRFPTYRFPDEDARRLAAERIADRAEEFGILWAEPARW